MTPDAVPVVPARLRRPLPAGFTPQAAPDAPLVSVVTVARDAAATIGGTLASVAAQSFTDLEHVVVDGGSTDATCRLVRAAPHRPRLVSEPDHGIYDAFNKGLALCRGQWITFLNADDVYAHAGVIEAVIGAARRAPGVGVFHADLDVVDGDGRTLREERFDPDAPWSFDLEMPVAHPTTFVARWVYAAVGGFDATYRVAGDYELLLRMHLAGLELRHIPEVLVRMREGGRSEVAARVGTWERKQAWLRCTGWPPWRLLVRELKLGMLDRWVPGISAALGAAKRLTVGARRHSRRPARPTR